MCRLEIRALFSMTMALSDVFSFASSAEEEVFCFFKIEVTAAENVNAIFGSLRGFGTLTFEEDGKCLEIAVWKNGGSSVEKSASRKEFSVIAAAAFFVGKLNEFT